MILLRKASNGYQQEQTKKHTNLQKHPTKMYTNFINSNAIEMIGCCLDR